MRFEYKVSVEVERESGLFVSRDEIDEAIREALSNAESDTDLDGIGANGDSTYTVVDWSID